MNNSLFLGLLFVAFSMISCDNPIKKGDIDKESKVVVVERESSQTHALSLINPSGKSIKTRFLLPKGFTRITSPGDTWTSFLQNQQLKPNGSKVFLYDKSLKGNQSAHAAVLDKDAGKGDLQQCADAIMRLRCDYFYERNAFEKIGFNFTNVFAFEYEKWRSGYDIQVNGNKVKWTTKGEKKEDYTSYRNYLQKLFMYAGTLSLSKELKSKEIKDLQIGDVFIKGGSPGHAVIIMDMAQNDKTEKIFLLAQSYMPAQDIHILNNPNDVEISPWYNLSDINEGLRTPEWSFEVSDLKEF